jgi:Flp pilus assembly secretin CpaC
MSFRALIPALAALAAALLPAAAEEPGNLVVIQDQAKLLRISAPAHTVIIGNPAIADATLQDSQTLVITGRSSGTTNLIILDQAGEPVEEQLITVGSPGGNAVSLFRGVQRFSLSCAPDCQPNVVPGDNDVYFKVITEQNAIRTGSAEETATGTPATGN